MARLTQDSLSISPLEEFVRDYVEAREGVWDEIEPQVYDLLIGAEITRVAFDPEALPEHPQAQLASLGSPLIDRLLGDAERRWSVGRFYRSGANLHPHDVESRVRRAISLPPEATISVSGARAMRFPQAVFWFKATFASDQKEEEIVPVAMDLHYLREVRHLDELLSGERLTTEPATPLPEARHPGLAAGYRAARGHVARTVAALANARRREWAGRIDKQISRMSAYYTQLRKEADERADRDGGEEAAAGAAQRRQAIEREETLRTAELRRKSAVSVHVRLSSAMLVHQPKLLMSADVEIKHKPIGRIEIVWDALSESVEPVPCPACGRPTFSLRIVRTGLACDQCAGQAKSSR